MLAVGSATRLVAIVLAVASVLSSLQWAFAPSRLQNVENPHWYLGLLINVCGIAFLMLPVSKRPRAFPWVAGMAFMLAAKLGADTELCQLVLMSIPPLPLCCDVPLIGWCGLCGSLAGVFYLRSVLR